MKCLSKKYKPTAFAMHQQVKPFPWRTDKEDFKNLGNIAVIKFGDIKVPNINHHKYRCKFSFKTRPHLFMKRIWENKNPQTSFYNKSQYWKWRFIVKWPEEKKKKAIFFCRQDIDKKGGQQLKRCKDRKGLHTEMPSIIPKTFWKEF